MDEVKNCGPCSRCNNVKIRGVPESVKQADLLPFFTDVMKAALPELPLEELLIDRIHRLPKPKHIPAHLPRNTIAHIHFYQTKETLMAAFRQVDQLPEQLQSLSLFIDLSAHTTQQCRQLATITKPLRNHHISYQWRYLAKLLITKDDRLYTINSLADGLRLLRDWQILEAENSTSEGPSSHHQELQERTCSTKHRPV